MLFNLKYKNSFFIARAAFISSFLFLISGAPEVFAQTATISPPPAPTLVCSVTPTTADTGTSVTWKVVATGGSGSYSYSWSGTDSLSGNTATVAKTYTTAGNKTGTASVKNVGYATVYSCSSTATIVSPSTAPSLTASPSESSSAPTCSLTTSKLFGYAWSDNIGWISMNGTATDGAKYGVTKDSCNYLNGYGWSDNIGWVKFDPDGPFPSGPGTIGISAVIASDGSVSGWIRACNGMGNIDPRQTVPNTTCSGASRDDGWDGWISMRGSTHGVTIAATPTAFCVSSSCSSTEFAWGSDVVGWVDFSGVFINTTNPNPSLTCTVSPSTAATGAAITWTATASGGSGSYTYSWVGTDGLSGTTASIVKSYATGGTKNGTITVANAGSPTQSASCSASVVITTTINPSAEPSASPSTEVSPPAPPGNIFIRVRSRYGIFTTTGGSTSSKARVQKGKDFVLVGSKGGYDSCIATSDAPSSDPRAESSNLSETTVVGAGQTIQQNTPFVLYTLRCLKKALADIAQAAIYVQAVDPTLEEK